MDHSVAIYCHTDYSLLLIHVGQLSIIIIVNYKHMRSLAKNNVI